MEKKEIRNTGEFTAYDDQGNPYSVYEYRTFTTRHTQGIRIGGETIRGEPSYKLRDGTTVRQLDDDAREFEIIGSGKKLHRRS